MRRPSFFALGGEDSMHALGLALLPLAISFWPGRLPGDVVIEREHFRLYLPFTTCLLASLLASAMLWLIRYLTRSSV